MRRDYHRKRSNSLVQKYEPKIQPSQLFLKDSSGAFLRQSTETYYREKCIKIKDTASAHVFLVRSVSDSNRGVSSLSNEEVYLHGLSILLLSKFSHTKRRDSLTHLLN